MVGKTITAAYGQLPCAVGHLTQPASSMWVLTGMTAGTSMGASTTTSTFAVVLAAEKFLVAFHPSMLNSVPPIVELAWFLGLPASEPTGERGGRVCGKHS